MARIEGQKITLMVFANNDEGEIMLTATDDAFGSANWLAIDVVSDHAESAMAELYDFQYRPMS